MADDALELANRARDLFTRHTYATAGNAVELEAELHSLLSDALKAGAIDGPKYTWLREVARKDPARVNWPLELYRAVETIRLSDIPHPAEIEPGREAVGFLIEQHGPLWALRHACGALGVMLANQAGAAVNGATLPPLSPEAVRILESLRRQYPETVTAENLARDTGIDPKTTGRECRYLLETGLAHKPLGERKGLTLTESGFSLLSRIGGLFPG